DKRSDEAQLFPVVGRFCWAGFLLDSSNSNSHNSSHNNDSNMLHYTNCPSPPWRCSGCSAAHNASGQPWSLHLQRSDADDTKTVPGQHSCNLERQSHADAAIGKGGETVHPTACTHDSAGASSEHRRLRQPAHGPAANDNNNINNSKPTEVLLLWAAVALGWWRL
ncbi:unnamed protein product, partial [Polarella glacialis]